MQYVQGKHIAQCGRQKFTFSTFEAAFLTAKNLASYGHRVHVLSTVCVIDPDGTTLHFKNE